MSGLTNSNYTNTTNQQPLQPQRNTGIWAILIALFVLGNLVAAVLFFTSRNKKDEEQLPKVAAATDEIGSNVALARAKRVQGLAYLEKNDFAKAKKYFQEAIRLSAGDGPKDLPELVRIATELSGESAKTAKKKKAPVKVAVKEEPTEVAVEVAEPKVEPVRVASTTTSNKRRKNKRRSRPKPKPRPKPVVVASVEAEPEPEPAPAPGFLLVTSNPSALTIYIDGENRGVTPARFILDPASYRVEIRKGGTVLASQTARLESGRVFSIDRDVSATLAPKKVVAEKKPDPKPEPKPVPKPKPVKKTVKSTGDLKVSSPNLHGEIWIDGKRSLGFPPLKVSKIAVGIHRVELRVDGVKRKSKVVRVVKNKTASIRF